MFLLAYGLQSLEHSLALYTTRWTFKPEFRTAREGRIGCLVVRRGIRYFLGWRDNYVWLRYVCIEIRPGSKKLSAQSATSIFASITIFN